MELLGTIVIGPKKINNNINGSLVISLNSGFKPPLIVSDIMTNKKFKPTYASKLNPRAFPSPNLINLFINLCLLFNYLILCIKYKIEAIYIYLP